MRPLLKRHYHCVYCIGRKANETRATAQNALPQHTESCGQRLSVLVRHIFAYISWRTRTKFHTVSQIDLSVRTRFVRFSYLLYTGTKNKRTCLNSVNSKTDVSPLTCEVFLEHLFAWWKSYMKNVAMIYIG
jgi:hypothetical protein